MGRTRGLRLGGVEGFPQYFRTLLLFVLEVLPVLCLLSSQFQGRVSRGWVGYYRFYRVG